jgi:hypothetical protein
VAIILVVLYHAGVPGVTGGYVGVDVFFVISGFVITGVLLRERESNNRTSIGEFYARRARRIIPAASLVIIVTVIAAFVYLGSLTGHETAVDGQWSALFLANFHFAASQTNYLASQSPPSALQNYWSLAVEEQFYVVYPTIFFITARIFAGLSLRLRLTFVLVAVIIASYVYSIVLTSTNAPSAYFSPFTRAWELALGGLIVVASDSLRRLPQYAAALLSWLGLRRNRRSEPRFLVDERVPRQSGGDSRPRHSTHYCQWNSATRMGGRKAHRTTTVSTHRIHFLFVVPVALAISRYCRPIPWRHELAGMGQRPAAPDCDAGGNHHLPDR